VNYFIENRENSGSKILWVTSEAVPRVTDIKEFSEASQETVKKISKPAVEHIFQDHEDDLIRVEQIVAEERATSDVELFFITPEKDRFSSVTNGNPVLEVDISRIVEIPEWKTKGHRKRFPKLQPNGHKVVFLDTVAFTGRTLEEVARQYHPALAVMELMGKYAPQKVSKLGVRTRYSKDISGFDGVWHIDDLVQDTPTEDGSKIKPSEFVKSVYPDLSRRRGEVEFLIGLAQYQIKEVQVSPNLFLELCRPDSYLARSFEKDYDIVRQAVPLLQRMEAVYRR